MCAAKMEGMGELKWACPLCSNRKDLVTLMRERFLLLWVFCE
ncbi:hypothetical protein RUMHYD_03892 [Blautia hydrogenotrophica DSM 10507]|uniref:Uncharacterized protein n=1 Tax=Blautia hydrogenotrophica (strain DSM 10507 / JCM 14656 / S5a33) TaxID=476272 RepID=C0CSM5_BLAHS|nr:hypothetical protein RUMHYD_03892 [Blautia hydrogenotrophica DSM 10507]